MTIELRFTREFSQQSPKEQKREFAQYLSDAVSGAVVRLKKKKLDYDLDLMQEDFERIVQAWVG
ncbi:hypothetical protein NG895_20715 [Aeoliella sp. ICT_H6.2]|uniref:Uncharacterized protein n=1 Tax=Aeoliella straminimaris TaxID=2954799 RepID=A0A9X2FD00_9BACT|nr:hypothetical protein [Aeoliella straminimaris]MCO6046329.1 hypothetical protein [Aeoliella straminimaris]